MPAVPHRFGWGFCTDVIRSSINLCNIVQIKYSAIKQTSGQAVCGMFKWRSLMSSFHPAGILCRQALLLCVHIDAPSMPSVLLKDFSSRVLREGWRTHICHSGQGAFPRSGSYRLAIPCTRPNMKILVSASSRCCSSPYLYLVTSSLTCQKSSKTFKTLSGSHESLVPMMSLPYYII
jgi:hypothetical protein